MKGYAFKVEASGLTKAHAIRAALTICGMAVTYPSQKTGWTCGYDEANAVGRFEEIPDTAPASTPRQFPAHRLAEILVRHKLIDPAAVNDPEGYDGAATMARVAGAAQELCEMLSTDQERQTP